MILERGESMSIRVLDSQLRQIDFSNDAIIVENGTLKKVTGIWDSLRYSFNRTSHQGEVREHLNSVVKKILKMDEISLRREDAALKRLFFSTLTGADYDRSLIQRWSILERILAPEFIHARFAGSTDAVTKRGIEESRLEAQFTLRLGLQPILVQGGASGTYLMRGRDGNPLGVFKPNDETPDGQNCPKFVGKCKSFGSKILSRCLPHDFIKIFLRRSGVVMDHAHLSETASSALDKILGLHVVPHTEVATFESPIFYGANKQKKGSFQLFGSGKEACDALNIQHVKKATRPKLYQEFAKPEHSRHKFRNFEEFALFDMLTGNIDRHFENWLLHKEKDGKFSIIAIDHGAAFPTKHPHRGERRRPGQGRFGWLNEYLSVKYMYLWETMPQANRPFSETMKQQILKIDPKRLGLMLKQYLIDNDLPQTEAFLSEKLDRLYERLQIIQMMVRQGATIREIAGIRTQKDFDTLL